MIEKIVMKGEEEDRGERYGNEIVIDGSDEDKSVERKKGKNKESELEDGEEMWCGIDEIGVEENENDERWGLKERWRKKEKKDWIERLIIKMEGMRIEMDRKLDDLLIDDSKRKEGKGN